MNFFTLRKVTVAMLVGAQSSLIAQAAPGPAPAPAPTPLTVSGVMFGQYAYALRNPAGTGHQNNFDITRAYLNFLGKWSGGVGGRVTADVYRNADGSLAFRLKYGFASYNPRGGPLTYKLGMLQTPFVEYDENLWDYRMQGQDPTDRAGYLSSSDIGMAVDGSWSGDKVTMSSGVYNGEFYSKAPGDKHKDVAARVSVRLAPSDEGGRFGGFRLTGFTLLGKPNGGGTRQRFLGQASYRSKRVTVGAFLMSTRDRTDTGTVALPTVSGRVASVLAVVRFPASKLAAIGRVDIHDRNTALPNDRLTRLIAGLSYQLNPNLRVLGDFEHTSYQGGAPTPALDAARSQALFQIQLVF